DGVTEGVRRLAEPAEVGERDAEQVPGVGLGRVEAEGVAVERFRPGRVAGLVVLPAVGQGFRGSGHGKGMANDGIRMANDESMTNDKCPMTKLVLRPWVIRASSLIRHSEFGIRH